MTLKEAIAEYAERIQHERRLARTTCKHYLSWLRGFLLWLADNGYPEPTLDDLTHSLLRRYQMHKAKQGCRPRTIHAAFHAIRGLCVYLVEQNHLTENPCHNLKMPKKDAAVRHVLTDANVEALFRACERQRTVRLVTLSRAVLATLAHGGLRRAELCDLRVDDVNLAEGSILIRSGKGSKARRIFVCKTAIQALREWLTLRRAEWEETCEKAERPKSEREFAEGWLFMFDRARRLHFNGIRTLFETLAASADLSDNPAVKPHSLRHWAATNFLRNGARLRDVQEFLGHSSIAVTERYLHSGEEQLRQAAELTALKPTVPEAAPIEDVKRLRLPQRREPQGSSRRIATR